MTRSLLLLRVYTVRYLLQWFAARAFLITIAINQAVAPVLGLALWTAAVPGDTTISTYYLAILIVQLATVSFENHTLANGIYDGNISHDLLQPQPVVLPCLGQNLALRLLHLAVGLPAVIGLSIAMQVTLAPRDALLALPALVIAAALRFLFTFALASVAFWTHRAHAVVGFGELIIFLLGGSAIPLMYVPDPYRGLVEVLPFRAMLGFPAEIVSGSITGPAILTGYALQATWVAVAASVALIVWRAGVRRYTAIGG